MPKEAQELPTLEELNPKHKDYATLFRNYSKPARALKFLRLLMAPFLWLAFSIAVMAGAVMTIGKSVINLFIGRPLDALAWLGVGIALLIASPFLAIISAFYPPLPKSLILGRLLPATRAPATESHKRTVVSLNHTDLPNQGLVDAHDIIYEGEKSPDNNKVILTFLGNADTYDSTKNPDATLRGLSNTLQSDLRIVNYPGYATQKPSTIDDVINAGISQVYALMRGESEHMQRNKTQLTKEYIEENICLQGRSMGGAVALQVALFFKQKYNLDLKVFVDRSFSSLDAAASNFTDLTGFPKWYQKLVIKLAFTAIGNWNMNSAEAIKALNPEAIRIVNVAFPENQEQENLSPYGKFVRALGLSLEKETSPDPIIQNGSTLGEACSMTHANGKSRFKRIYMQNPTQDSDSHNEDLGHFKTKEKAGEEGRAAPLVALKLFQPKLYRIVHPKNNTPRNDGPA